MSDFQLELNGEPVSVGEDLIIGPWMRNTLRLRTGRRDTQRPAYAVTLEKELPNGHSTTEAITAPQGGEVAFDLGPVTMPPRYVYEAGVVFHLGYRLSITVRTGNARGRGPSEVLFHRSWNQIPHISMGRRSTVATESRTDRMMPGDKPRPWDRELPPDSLLLSASEPRRVVFNPNHGAEAVLDFRLHEDVLRDPDNVRVLYRINRGAPVREAECRVRLCRPDGQADFEESVTVSQSDAPGELSIPVRGLPDGEYVLAMHPVVDGRLWEEGPELRYRRRTPKESVVRISPYAPWELTRDASRHEMAVEDPCGDSGIDEPTEIAVTTRGLCAVFATPRDHGCMLRVGDDPVVRTIPGPSVAPYSSLPGHDVFVAVADLTENSIQVYPFRPHGGRTVISGLAHLRVVPVTPQSVDAFRAAVSRPQVSLHGVNDWEVYFANSERHVPPRMEQDAYDTIVAAQGELGLQTLDWSVGRSVVLYESRLPGVRRACPGPSGLDPLSEALRAADARGVRLNGWLAMMYYGPQLPWDHGWGPDDRTAPLYHEHPEYRAHLKNEPLSENGLPPVRHGGGQLLSFYFPQVRREKVEILTEVAERGAAGVLVGTCRLAPMMDYHPAMVDEYRRTHGVDPLTIDASRGAAAAQAYRHWITWRADFFSDLLRELRERLRPVEERLSRRVPVGVRLPSTGLDLNLAQGLHVERWLSEDLVDVIQLDPFEQRGDGQCNPHDVRPYLALGRRFGVPVFGGLGQTWMWGGPQAHPAAMRRVLGILEAGAHGIELYETELLAHCSHHRWLAPLFGHPQRLRAFLDEANVEACHPITARTCLYGYDNASRWTEWYPEGERRTVWKMHGLGPDCL